MQSCARTVVSWKIRFVASSFEFLLLIYVADPLKLNCFTFDTVVGSFLLLNLHAFKFIYLELIWVNFDIIWLIVVMILL
jgi:hypothetical protein